MIERKEERGMLEIKHETGVNGQNNRCLRWIIFKETTCMYFLHVPVCDIYIVNSRINLGTVPDMVTVVSMLSKQPCSI